MDAGALPALVAAEAGASGSEDLRAKCRKALKTAVSHLTFLPALDALAQRSGPYLGLVDDLLLMIMFALYWQCSASLHLLKTQPALAIYSILWGLLVNTIVPAGLSQRYCCWPTAGISAPYCAGPVARQTWTVQGTA